MTQKKFLKELRTIGERIRANPDANTRESVIMPSSMVKGLGASMHPPRTRVPSGLENVGQLVEATSGCVIVGTHTATYKPWSTADDPYEPFLYKEVTFVLAKPPAQTKKKSLLSRLTTAR